MTETTLPNIPGGALTGALSSDSAVIVIDNAGTTYYMTLAELRAAITREYTLNNVPSAPASGLSLFSRRKAGLDQLAYRPALGDDVELQRFDGSADTVMITAVPGSATPSVLGCVTAGAGTSRTPASTNLFTGYKRVGVVTAASANVNQGLRTTTASFFRGDAPGKGGFFAVLRFGVNASITNSRIAAGFQNWGATTDPVNATDSFFVGKDSADTNLQVFYNDASGTCTKIDLGANFPANTSATDMYEARFFCLPSGSTMFYSVERLNTGDYTEGSVNTNLPTTTTFMQLGVVVATGSTASAFGVDIVSIYAVSGQV